MVWVNKDSLFVKGHEGLELYCGCIVNVKNRFRQLWFFETVSKNHDLDMLESDVNLGREGGFS